MDLHRCRTSSAMAVAAIAGAFATTANADSRQLLGLGSAAAYSASECRAAAYDVQASTLETDREILKALDAAPARPSRFGADQWDQATFNARVLNTIYRDRNAYDDTYLIKLAQAQAVLMWSIHGWNAVSSPQWVERMINGVPPLSRGDVTETGTNLSALHTVEYPSLVFMDLAFKLYAPKTAQKVAGFFNAAIAHVNLPLARLLCEELGIPMTLPVNLQGFDLWYGYNLYGARSPRSYDLSRYLFLFEESRNDLAHGTFDTKSDAVQAYYAGPPTMDDFAVGRYSAVAGHLSANYAALRNDQIDPGSVFNASPFRGLAASPDDAPQQASQSSGNFTKEQLTPTRPPECQKCLDDGLDDSIIYGLLGAGLGFSATRSAAGAIMAGGSAVLFKLYDTLKACRDACYANPKVNAQQAVKTKLTTNPLDDILDFTKGHADIFDENTEAHIEAASSAGAYNNIAPPEEFDLLKIPDLSTNPVEPPANDIPPGISLPAPPPPQPPLILRPPG